MLRLKNGIRLAATIIIATFLIVLIGGCFSEKHDELAALNPNEAVKLRMMYFNKKAFDEKYGILFTSKFPNIEIEVVWPNDLAGNMNEKMQAFIEKEKPDVLLLNSWQLHDVVKAGLLMNLDTLIKQDNFNLDGIHSGVLDMIRAAGDDSLYGLAPDFRTNALYYNIDLFEKYRIELPHDRMTWEEVLALARRFPSEGSEKERIYGFQPQYGQGLYEYISNIGSTMGLSKVSADGEQVVINSEPWKKVFQMVLDAYHSKVLEIKTGKTQSELMSESLDYKKDHFMNNRAAMKLDDTFYLSQLANYQKHLDPEKSARRIGIVTTPVDPKTPNITESFFLTNIFGLYAKSEQKRAAWEFVKYVNSEESAKVQSRTIDVTLLSRKAYAKSMPQMNIEPFFELKPDIGEIKRKNTVPYSFYDIFRDLVERELQLVVDGKESLDEALKVLEENGQQALEEAMIKEKQKKEKEGNQ